MKNIILTNEEINKLSLLSKNSHGCYGICYDYSGQVLKLFKRELDIEALNKIKKNLKRKSEVIMYPTNKVLLMAEKTTFKGYLCNKAPGDDLSVFRYLIKEGKKDISFDSFLTGYYDKFLPQLKKEDVLLSDVKLQHIFFHDCFYLIDTDWYTDRPNDMSIKEKNEKNINKFNTYLNNFVFYFLSIEVCNNLEFNISLEDRYKEVYIEKIFEGIRKATNGEVNSFNELYNYKYSDDEQKESIITL